MSGIEFQGRNEGVAVRLSLWEIAVMIKASLATKILVLATPVIWIGWDLYVDFTAGNSATESATIFRWAYHAPGVALLVGILMGHLFIPQTEVLSELAAEDAKKP